MTDTEDVNHVPGSINDRSHGSHVPAQVSRVGGRSPASDALAYASLERARAVLASHKTAIKTPRWW